MSSADPVVNRRGVLAGGVALAALGVVTSACGESPPKPPAVEELLGPLDQARKDSALAGAAAAAVGNPPQIAAALTVVASQRAAHARALSTEISRAAGKITTSSTSETSAPGHQGDRVRRRAGRDDRGQQPRPVARFARHQAVGAVRRGAQRVDDVGHRRRGRRWAGRCGRVGGVLGELDARPHV
nr:hypothetical protein [Mycobacterium sp. E2497]